MAYKILYVHPSNELYGADRSLLRLIKTLDRNRFDPIVAVANDIPYEGLLAHELSKENVPVYNFKLGVLRRRYLNPLGIMKFSYHTLQTAVQLATFCRHHQVSLIHSNSSAVISGGLAATLAKIPHIWHVREIIQQPRLLNNFIANNISLFATHAIAVSNPVKDNLLLAQPKLKNKIHIIHNGIDVDKFSNIPASTRQATRTSWNITDNEIVIGMVGRVSSWKGQTFLLEAMKIIAPKHPDARLVFVGGHIPGEEWRLHELHQKVHEMGLTHQVHIQPFSSAIPAILAGFDIFVLPSIKPDPFPTVVLEAMAAGKAIVATAHGGPLEQLEPDISGHLVSHSNPQEMATKLSQLLLNQTMRQELGQMAQNRAKQQFTTETYTANVSQLYQQTIQSVI